MRLSSAGASRGCCRRRVLSGPLRPRHGARSRRAAGRARGQARRAAGPPRACACCRRRGAPRAAAARAGRRAGRGGAPTCAMLEQMRFVAGGHELARASLGLAGVLAGRPFIEGHVRRARARAAGRRARASGCEVPGLSAADARRVTGVRARGEDAERAIDADLVVCASGRSAQVPAWLSSARLPHRRRSRRLALDVRYASRLLRLPARRAGRRQDRPHRRPARAAARACLFAQEDERWIASISGYGLDHRPPARRRRLRAVRGHGRAADVLARFAPPSRSTESPRTASRPAAGAATTGSPLP